MICGSMRSRVLLGTNNPQIRAWGGSSKPREALILLGPDFLGKVTEVCRHLEAVTSHFEPAAWLPGTASLLLAPYFSRFAPWYCYAAPWISRFAPWYHFVETRIEMHFCQELRYTTRHLLLLKDPHTEKVN